MPPRAQAPACPNVPNDPNDPNVPNDPNDPNDPNVPNVPNDYPDAHPPSIGSAAPVISAAASVHR